MTDKPAFTPHGENLFGDAVEAPHSSTLGDSFLVPPFSVLNAREGWWQERKRAWLALGIQSELGRGGQSKLTMSETVQRLKPSADQAAWRRRAETTCQPPTTASAAPKATGAEGQ
jgi:hypothetical protein